MTGFCPSCGSPRAGGEFCPSCGRPLEDDLGQVPTAPTKRSGPGRAELLVLILIGGAIIIGLQMISRGGASPSGVSAADVPPTGVIWFGSSFDTETLEIRGRTSTVGKTNPFSLVAHLPRSMDASDLGMRVYLDGALITSTGLGATGSGELWGFSPGPLFQAGTWKYEITDIGGNTLASGAIIATE